MGTCSIRAHVRGRWQNRNAHGGRAWPSSGWRPVWPELCESGGCGKGVTGEWGTGPGFRWPRSSWGDRGAGVQGLQRRRRWAPPGPRTEGLQCRERWSRGEGPFGEGVVVGTPHPGRTAFQRERGAMPQGPKSSRLAPVGRAHGNCVSHARG